MKSLTFIGLGFLAGLGAILIFMSTHPAPSPKPPVQHAKAAPAFAAGTLGPTGIGLTSSCCITATNSFGVASGLTGQVLQGVDVTITSTVTMEKLTIHADGSFKCSKPVMSADEARAAIGAQYASIYLALCRKHP